MAAAETFPVAFRLPRLPEKAVAISRERRPFAYRRSPDQKCGQVLLANPPGSVKSVITLFNRGESGRTGDATSFREPVIRASSVSAVDINEVKSCAFWPLWAIHHLVTLGNRNGLSPLTSGEESNAGAIHHPHQCRLPKCGANMVRVSMFPVEKHNAVIWAPSGNRWRR